MINKIDKAKGSQVTDKTAYWKEKLPNIKQIIPVSAATGENVTELFDTVLSHIPVNPPFFPEGDISDRTERFFAAEIVREKIFFTYQQEIPYSTEVIITEFKE
mgnify:CR=1 FL=1